MQKTKSSNLISWQDWQVKNIFRILDLAQKIKRKPHKYVDVLRAKTLIMLFQKSSTRTRISFETAMTELGGHAIFLDWASTNFNLSKISYETEAISQYASLIMARMKKHKDILELERASSVPVIDGCCDRYHPCQALADFLTMYEDRGSFQGLKLCYVGVHNNVANSLCELALLLEVKIHLVCPIVPNEIVDKNIKRKLKEKDLLNEENDLKIGIHEADYVYTDTWLDLEYFGKKEFENIQEERSRIMLPYQINKDLMKDASAKILHDMPIHVGYEISEEMVHDSRSLIFKQSANRLHAQKAIILFLLGLD